MTKHKNTQKVKDGRKLHLNFIHFSSLSPVQLSLMRGCSVLFLLFFFLIFIFIFVSHVSFFLSLAFVILILSPSPPYFHSLLVIVCACLLFSPHFVSSIPFSTQVTHQSKQSAQVDSPSHTHSRERRGETIKKASERETTLSYS